MTDHLDTRYLSNMIFELPLYYLSTQTAGIASETEFRTFWIKTGSEDGKFTVAAGKGGETEAFMSQTWNYQKHSPLKYVAFATWWHSSGVFKFPPHDPIESTGYRYKKYLEANI